MPMHIFFFVFLKPTKCNQTSRSILRNCTTSYKVYHTHSQATISSFQMDRRPSRYGLRIEVHGRNVCSANSTLHSIESTQTPVRTAIQSHAHAWRPVSTSTDAYNLHKPRKKPPIPYTSQKTHYTWHVQTNEGLLRVRGMESPGENASSQNVQPQSQMHTVLEYDAGREIHLLEMRCSMPGMQVIRDSDALHDAGGLFKMRPMPDGPGFLKK